MRTFKDSNLLLFTLRAREVLNKKIESEWRDC